MKSEYRIYYESIEQAEHFVKPLLKIKNSDIKLVKLTSNCLNLSHRVASIVSLKNPDILITKLEGEEEYPLIFIEFSNAVFTEDHELQRFDGMVASAKNNCIYVKISPLKKSSQSGRHGGNTNFDYLKPYSAIIKKFKKVFYHFEWECNKEGDLEVDEEYLSCPKGILQLEKFLKVFSTFVSKIPITLSWEEEFRKLLNKSVKSFKQWEETLISTAETNLSNLNSSRTTWLPEKNTLILKLNRFGHAMDPERGMLSYYGTIYDNIVSKMIFDKDNPAWFKATSSENKIREYLRINGLNNAKDFLFCFIYGSGLNTVPDFLKIYENLTTECKYFEFDITEIIDNNYSILTKHMRTIFDFSKEMLIYDSSNNITLKLFWSKKDRKICFSQKTAKLIEKDYLDEDDVTYITVHNFLKENKLKVLASSFHGAQGDRVLLVNPHTGRSQERTYLDVVAYLPKKFSAIQENKPEFNNTSINKDIEKIVLFKTDSRHKQAFSKFVERYDKRAPLILKIGVGFWASERFSLENIRETNLEKLDYFLFIDRKVKSWKVWSSSDTKLFKKTSGKVKIPKTWEVKNE